MHLSWKKVLAWTIVVSASVALLGLALYYGPLEFRVFSGVLAGALIVVWALATVLE